MLTFDSSLTNALKNANTTAFWVLKLYYNDESNFIGVSDRHRQDGSDIYYGLVASWGSYRQSLDFFNFTTSIGNMNVSLINSERSIQGKRFSDLLADYNFANRKWELFLNTNETATLDTSARMIATGIISGEINYDENNTTLTLLDYSSRRHKVVPTNTVDSTYPNAPENNKGKPIPMAYGDFYEKTDLGTIPTTYFDRFQNFYKGAFPAIITDKWDVGESASEAKVDSQAVDTLDSENVYIYKNGYYPTLMGTVDATTNNPLIEFSGSTASFYIPMSASGQGSGTINGSGSITTPSNAVDGDFQTKATIQANGAVSANSDAAIYYAIPKVNRAGDYDDINIITKYGTATDLSNELDDYFSIGGVTIGSITSDSETETGIPGLFTSTQQESFDFEKNVEYKLFSDAENESVEIYETGVKIDLNIEDIESHEVTELVEAIRPSTRGQGLEANVWDGGEEKYTFTRTKSQGTPAKIDYIYCSGKGRKYPAFIDADSRNQGYNQNDLIENPVFMMEDILRTELSLTSSDIDYASFDTSGNTTNGYLGDIYEDAVGDIKFAFSQYKFINSKDLLNRLARLCFSYIFVSGDGKFKIKTLRRSDDYSSADQTIDFGDINIHKVGKTSLGAVKNSIVAKYDHNYGAKQNKAEATATDSTSQGSTVDGFNQVMKLEVDAAEILDSTTATKLAEAYLYLMKDRKDMVELSCSRPKYNHLEIGDIINFSDWPIDLKIYGQTMGGSWSSTTDTFSTPTTTWSNMAAGYFIISDITKSVTGCQIKAIKVS